MIKQIEDSRQYFNGELQEDINEKRLPEGVKIFGDMIKFPKKEFKTWDECLQKMLELFPAGEQVKEKAFELKRKKSLELTDADWELMQGLMLNPDRFKKEDFRIFEAWLANNYVDRDGERFRKDVLNSFAKTIIGKSVQMNHDWEATGQGRYYVASVQKVSLAEAFEIAGPQPNKNFLSMLQKVEEVDGGIYWLVVKYYVLKSNEKLIELIDAGIVSDMSIGFRAPKLEGYKESGSDNVLWWEYQNTESREAEALEGSLVFLGAQYGARTRKEAETPEIKNADEKTFIKVETKKEVLNMKIEIKSLKKEIDVPIEKDSEKVITDFIAEIESEVATLQESAKTANEATAKLAKVIELVGPDYEKEIESLKQTKADVRDNLIAEAVKFGQLVKVISTETLATWKGVFDKLDIKEIETHLKEFQRLYNEQHPNNGQIENNEKNIEQKKTESPNLQRAFSAPVI